MIWATVLLAAAVLAIPSPATVRAQRGLAATGARRPPATGGDALAVAASLDVLAACLRSGMAVSTAAAAVADSAPAALAAVLRRAADLLALGADPSRAWTSSVGTEDNNHLQAFLRMARRSAASGIALAQGVEDLAVQIRGDATDAANARAERASVLMAGPLGLCYLPAFLCLGIVPVVAGLAGKVLQSGVL